MISRLTMALAFGPPYVIRAVLLDRTRSSGMILPASFTTRLLPLQELKRRERARSSSRPAKAGEE